MDEYKLVYELTDGSKQVSEWMTEAEARKQFNKLKANRNGESSNIVWCELIYSSLAEDAEDEEFVVDEFTKKVVDFFGSKFTI